MILRLRKFLSLSLEGWGTKISQPPWGGGLSPFLWVDLCILVGSSWWVTFLAHTQRESTGILCTRISRGKSNLTSLKSIIKLGAVVHICNPSPWETEAGLLWVRGCRARLCQKKKSVLVHKQKYSFNLALTTECASLKTQWIRMEKAYQALLLIHEGEMIPAWWTMALWLYFCG